MPWNSDFTEDHFESPTKIAEITEAVQLQYELFPYPGSPIETSAAPQSGFIPLQSYILGQYSRCFQLQDPHGKRALSAGCGTGREIHTLAVLNPGLEIIGCDLSQTSLRMAQQRIEYHQLKNCHVQPANLLDLDSLPEGLFDFILSFGVLHHTANIQLALQNLTQKLHPQGVMALMLYSRSGRRGLYLLREALQLLGIYDLPIEAGMTFVRQLLQHSVPGSYLHVYAQVHQQYYQFDENLVDNCFHPMDRAYDIHEVPDLLQTFNLTLLDVPPYRQYWLPQTIVDTGFKAFYERYDQLPLVSRLRVLEVLNPEWETQNLFWCCHNGSQVAQPEFNLANFKDHRWQLNPVFKRFSQIQMPFATVEDQFFSQTTRDPSTQVVIKWPYFQNRSRTEHILVSELQDLLLPLSDQPMTGAAILQEHPIDQQVALLKRFQTWEEQRIVLRT